MERIRNREQHEQKYVDMQVNGIFREDYVEKLVRNEATRYIDAGLWKDRTVRLGIELYFQSKDQLSTVLYSFIFSLLL